MLGSNFQPKLDRVTMNALKKFIRRSISPRLVLNVLTWKHLKQEYAELNLVKDLIPKNTVALDIGVYMGVFSNVMARYAKKVYSFEPHPEHFAFCTKALPNNVEVINSALSNEEGEIILTVPKKYPSAGKIGGSFEGLEVIEYKVNKAVLDTYKFENVSVIKIDAEGHEYEILQGASDIIKNNKPCLIVEIEQRHQERKIQEVFDLILNFGYKGFFILNHKLIRIEEFSMALQKNHEIGVYGKYVNNFIFIHEDKLQYYTQFPS